MTGPLVTTYGLQEEEKSLPFFAASSDSFSILLRSKVFQKP